MKVLRALLLVSVCFLDLHVRADQSVIDAGSARRTFALDQTKIVLSRGGLAVADRSGGPAVRLLAGRAFVSGSLTLSTPFARFSCAGACAALFSREADAVVIEALGEGWSLVRTGDASEYAVGAATRVRVGGVGRGGRAELSTAESIPWTPLITNWASLFPGASEDFVAAVHDFRPTWTAAVERLSRAQGGRALAMIGASEAVAARELARARANAAEDAAIKADFRRRNFVD